jgi:cytochrome P450
MGNQRFDFSDEGLLRDPYPGYERLRSAGPVVWDDMAQGWFVTDYTQARQLARDERLSARVDRTPIVTALPVRLAKEAHRLKDHFESWMLFSDPPRHTRLRSRVAPALAGTTVDSYDPELRRRARELLALAGSELDVMSDYAVPLASRNLAQVFGVPEDMLAESPRWAHEIVAFLNIDFAQEQEAGEQATRTARVIDEISHFIDELCRVQPAAGSVGAALREALDIEEFDHSDAEGVVAQIISGTCAAQPYLVGNLAMALWKTTPTPVSDYDYDNVVEEILRFEPSFLLIPRTATVDMEMGGSTIRGGDRIGVLIGAVNRDPAEFACPHAFDPGRVRNPHLTFGLRPHYCLGSSLVRVYARVALGELVAAFPPAVTSLRADRHAPYFGTRVPQGVRLSRE